MNLAELDNANLANQGVALELRGPDGAPLLKADGAAVTITVLGADSDIAVRARNANMNRRIQLGPRAKVTAEAIEGEAVGYLAKLTVGWDGVGIDEDDTSFSHENAVRLYTRFRFIREQVDAFVEDRANFLRA